MAIGKEKNLLPMGLDGDPLGDDQGGSPTDSLANLMDVMLVFACGLIVALVAHYGVQLGATQPDGMQEISSSQVEQASQSDSEKSGIYDEVGTVYRDAATGKLYVVTPDGESLEGE